MPTDDWCCEDHADRIRFGLKVRERIFAGRSEFQHVEVVDTELFGRTLLLDGIFQTSEGEEFFYHEMIAHPVLTTAPRLSDVLIIGGGDGGTAREVLRHPDVERVVMVEIDQLVVDVSRAHLPGLGAGAWADSRLDLRIGDGIAFVAGAPGDSFDVVLLDGSDPVGPSEGLFNESFYRNVARVLRSGGVFGLQSESPVVVDETFFAIQRTLHGIFDRVHPYFGCAPIYGVSPWSWTFATDSVDPLAIVEERALRLEPTLRYYNRDIHKAAFAQPGEVKRRLAHL